jgi:tRNA(Ile)-lysidine synthase
MPPSFELPEFIHPNDLVLIAVSGGGDSVYLTHELCAASRTAGFRLCLGHVNHGRRGREDEMEREFVRGLASELGLGFSPLELRVPVEGDHSLEDRLREGRLEALFAEARTLGAVAIAFGHTADDLAETFLLMAMRGSGPTGLGSLRAEKWLPHEGIHLWRPLLHHTRNDIRESLCSRGIAWVDDSTNEMPIHRRNRLRAGILPLLVEEEPAAVSLLARSARLCGEASVLLNTLAKEDLSNAAVATEPNVLVLRNQVLRSLSKPRLAIALRGAWNLLAGGRFPLPPPSNWTNEIAERILSDRPNISCFNGAVVCVRVDTHHTLIHSSLVESERAVEILMDATQPTILLATTHSVHFVANSSQRSSSLNSRIVLGDGQGSLHLEVTEKASQPVDWSPAQDSDLQTAFFDAASIRRDLILRAAHDEELISMGPAGSKSVMAALQESGIPPELRSRVAVLADDRGILWIPGVRRAVSAYVTDRTTLVLKLEWRRSRTEELHPA